MSGTTLHDEQRRIDRTIPRFIEPLLARDWEVLSIGCGAGADVVRLRRDGFQAWGLDPSRLSLESLPEDLRQYFRVGTANDRPFGEKQFDFAYAFDVIEHVGCTEFGTRLEPDAAEVRREFLASAFSCLNVGGSLLLTTSNRLCPIDPGHWHRYHRLGRRYPDRRKFGVSIPWDRRNFLLSVGDIDALMTTVVGPGAFRVETVPTATYPNISERRSVPARAATAILRLLDLRPLRGSPLAPILIVRIVRLA